MANERETSTPKSVKPVDYDERVYRKGHPPHRARIALLAIFLLIVGTYFAWTKELPFGDPYELNATFSNAANIRADSPVRIAGVNVGKVTEVRRAGENAEVTFTVDDEGQPIHEDAEVEIRPRIFLEGNFFLDLQPGSPSGRELDSGDDIPITQTATAVQLDEVLTALQAPDRENLIRLLEGFGTGLNHVPTAAEDTGQDPDAQGETAGEAINDTFKYGAAAGRDSAIVAEALQGAEARDLSRLLASQRDVFAALVARELQLQDLITNFNTTMRAFAIESDNLGETFRELAPTLQAARPSLLHLNQSFPALRAFARDITPGIKQLPATIEASPAWLRQTYRLLGPRELKYIARQLRLTGIPAAKAAGSGPGLFFQLGQFSRCFTDVMIPTGDAVIPNLGTDNFSTGQTNFREFLYSAVNLAGLSQNFDGNGPYIRIQGSGGENSIASDNPGNAGVLNEFLWGNAINGPQGNPLGTRPSIANSPRPAFRPDVACHTQPVPSFTSSASAIGPPSPVNQAFPFP